MSLLDLVAVYRIESFSGSFPNPPEGSSELLTKKVLWVPQEKPL